MKQNATLKRVKLNDNSVLIKKFIKGIDGGRTLDVTGFVGDVIQCGHIIISKTTEGVKTYMPLGVEEITLSEGKKMVYKALAEGEKFEGILVSSILKEKPAAAILTWGIVNEAVLPYALESANTEKDGVVSFKDEFLKAVPHISFEIDEEA